MRFRGRLKRYLARRALNRRSNRHCGLYDRIYVNPHDDPDLKALKKELNTTRHIPGIIRSGAIAAVWRAETWGIRG